MMKLFDRIKKWFQPKPKPPSALSQFSEDTEKIIQGVHTRLEGTIESVDLTLESTEYLLNAEGSRVSAELKAAFAKAKNRIDDLPTLPTPLPPKE